MPRRRITKSIFFTMARHIHCSIVDDWGSSRERFGLGSMSRFGELGGVD